MNVVIILYYSNLGWCYHLKIHDIVCKCVVKQIDISNLK